LQRSFVQSSGNLEIQTGWPSLLPEEKYLFVHKSWEHLTRQATR